jgi:hypothetical protein
MIHEKPLASVKQGWKQPLVEVRLVQEIFQSNLHLVKVQH